MELKGFTDVFCDLGGDPKSLKCESCWVNPSNEESTTVKITQITSGKRKKKN